MDSPRTAPSTPHKIGWILCRVLVPLWVLAGATFKLIAASPRNLPQTLTDIGEMLQAEVGVSIYAFLAALVSIEFFAILGMLLLPRFARLIAMFVLTVFCGVLISEMVQGRFADCGCFGGKVTVPPWATFSIDLLLLIGVMIFRTRTDATPRWALPTVLVAGLGLSALTFVHIMGEGSAPAPVPGPNGATDPTPENGDPAPIVAWTPGETTNGAPRAQPAAWFTPPDVSAWVGKPWHEIEPFVFMPQWPTIQATGRHHVIFYSRTCSHCEEMMYRDLTRPFDDPVSLVEIPADKNIARSPDAWPMPPIDDSIEQAAPLPLGTLWTFNSPCIVTIEDGVIICAEEGTHHNCMGVEPLDDP